MMHSSPAFSRKNKPAMPMCKPSQAKAETDEFAGLRTMALGSLTTDHTPVCLVVQPN
jgi:hypothetical protein